MSEAAYLPQNDAVSYAAFVKAEKRRRALQYATRLPALEKASDLLESVLNPWQEMTNTERYWFIAIGSNEGQYFLGESSGDNPILLRLNDRPVDYEIGQQQDVYPVGQYCFHAEHDGWPLDDQLATLKLWLDSDEEKFLWYANFTRDLHPCWRIAVPYEVHLTRSLAKAAREVNAVLDDKRTRTLAERIKANQYWAKCLIDYRRAPRI